VHYGLASVWVAARSDATEAADGVEVAVRAVGRARVRAAAWESPIAGLGVMAAAHTRA